ncbi:flavin reductase family protein, partial [Streptomyces sp. NPDC059956]|uniref:flavin reductase family protein n=1 Tax=Streptomyces sp. NPDC059956 TaxID=3347015 RepID=UPI003651015C
AGEMPGRRHSGVTVNSLTSLSLEPPLVALSFGAGSRFLADLMTSRVWGVSLLDAASADTASQLTRSKEERDRTLLRLATRTGERTGVLLLEGTGWLECRYRKHLVTGDHVLVIGEVVGLGESAQQPPLIFLGGGFHQLPTERV